MFSLVNPEINVCKTAVAHMVVRAWSMQTTNIQMSKSHRVHAYALLGDTNENKNKSKTHAKLQHCVYKKSLPPYSLRMAVMITFLFYILSLMSAQSGDIYLPIYENQQCDISAKVWPSYGDICMRAE